MILKGAKISSNPAASAVSPNLVTELETLSMPLANASKIPVKILGTAPATPATHLTGLVKVVAMNLPAPIN